MHFNNKTCNVFLKPYVALRLMKMKETVLTRRMWHFSKAKILNLIFSKPRDNSLKVFFFKNQL